MIIFRQQLCKIFSLSGKGEICYEQTIYNGIGADVDLLSEV
jgi:hypothetical protein